MIWKFDKESACPYCGNQVAELKTINDLYMFYCNECGQTPVPIHLAAPNWGWAICEYSECAKKVRENIDGCN